MWSIILRGQAGQPKVLQSLPYLTVSAVRLFQIISGSWLTFLCSEQINGAAISISERGRRLLNEMIQRELLGKRYSVYLL